jgi:hypothetical protein
MAFHPDLIEKLKSGLQVGKFSTALALGGLTSLIISNSANAQSANLGVTFRDLEGNVVPNGSNLKQGRQYQVDIDFTSFRDNLDVSSVLSTLKVIFENGAKSEDINFDYTALPMPCGTPATNDLFASSNTTNLNTYFNPLNSATNLLDFSRCATNNYPVLNNGQTVNVASLYFVSNCGRGSIALNFETAPHETKVVTGPQYLDFATLANGSDVQLINGTNSFTANFSPSLHSADTNEDSRINLLELTRVIELYNTRNGTVRTGAYTVQSGTEDGFAADPSALSTGSTPLIRYHSADSNRDGRINLLELTRVIELYNYRSGTVRTGQYHIQDGTEDGFAAGPEVISASNPLNMPLTLTAIMGPSPLGAMVIPTPQFQIVK